MRRTIRFFDWVSVVLIVYVMAAAIPLSAFWFQPGQTIVSDTVEGTSPRIGFTRVIKRPVRMRYNVVVRHVPSLEVACEASSGVFTSRPDATLPESIILAWWAPGDARCAVLKPGEYVMETCWTAPAIWRVLPPKKVCRDSNVFTVHPAAWPGGTQSRQNNRRSDADGDSL